MLRLQLLLASLQTLEVPARKDACSAAVGLSVLPIHCYPEAQAESALLEPLAAEAEKPLDRDLPMEILAREPCLQNREDQ